MLEVQGLIKRYNRIPAVDGVSFTIRPGEILGYVGPNGAGKSTTVKMLTGLIEPTSGEILFHGRNVREDWVGFQRRMGYVPEEPYLYTHLTGREYLQLVGRLRGMEKATLDRRIDAMLDLFGLADFRDTQMSSYSKGMRQKVLLSAALLHDPDVLILDEPFSGLDVTAALVFRTLLPVLAKQGKMILYSSHVLEVVEKVCSEVCNSASRPCCSPRLCRSAAGIAIVVFARGGVCSTRDRGRRGRRGHADDRRNAGLIVRERFKAWLEDTHGALFELHRHYARQLCESDLITSADDLRRVVITCLAGVASIGFIVPKLYYKKYQYLALGPDTDLYRRAVYS